MTDDPNGPGAFSHVDQRGAVRMVDVSQKQSTHRRAIARCWVTLAPAALRHLEDDREAQRVLGDARVVGLMAAKQTPALIPLCHPIMVDALTLNFALSDRGVEIEAGATAFERTGLEMEALTACAIAALSIVNEFRKSDSRPTVEGLTLWEKSGGRSGHFRRADLSPPSNG